eukprot:CAMPEP_0173062390 /NCGR_PEP_ID=MMETSP1102-20130122/3786_1 /TAXON_ID=49646 /ORGANISM="Geminigera sp., Strain Caron Lab Isolate" /LENGTH=103 /DNA_ID=CAMNT_0013929045 /DNA_START=32 /DNA_END=343 /DNA_ORIENTATION=+
MSMYIRVKRQKQTVFLQCDPSDTIMSLKRKLASINNLEIKEIKLVLIEDGIALDNDKTVRECKLDATDGSVVALLYQDNTLEAGWESIDIHDYKNFSSTEVKE